MGSSVLSEPIGCSECHYRLLSFITEVGSSCSLSGNDFYWLSNIATSFHETTVTGIAALRISLQFSVPDLKTHPYVRTGVVGILSYGFGTDSQCSVI